jgi:hypothetical protein
MTVDDLDLIRSFSPAVEEPGPEVYAKVRAAIAARAAAPRGARPRPASWRVRARTTVRRRRLGPVGAIAACVLAVIVLLAGTSSQTAQSSAAELLDRAAAAATLQTLGHGQYYYERFRALTPIYGPMTPKAGPRYVVNVEVEGQTWIAADGSGHVAAHARETFPSALDRLRFRADGAPALDRLLGALNRRLRPGQTVNTALPYFGLELSELLALVDRPQQLEARLRFAAAHPVPRRLDVPDAPAPGLPTSEGGLVAAMLGSGDGAIGGSTPLPPALRAALYRILARQPGVKLLARITDHLGRVGTGVSLGPETMIFDPRTYALRESRTNVPGNAWYTTVVSSGIVGSASATR